MADELEVNEPSGKDGQAAEIASEEATKDDAASRNAGTRRGNVFIPRRDAGSGAEGGTADRPAVSSELKELAQSTKKVARTMLDHGAVEDAVGQIASEQAAKDDTTSENAGTRKVNVFIPRRDASSGAEGGTDDRPAVSSELKELAQSTKKVARTTLDLGAIKDVVKRSFNEREAKLAEELINKPIEAPKHFTPIEKFRNAAPCGIRWDAMKGTDRARFCEKCQLQVYDFTKTEMPEAEEIIFKNEGKKNFVLYKRKDGKFLTADCPVGARRKQTVMVASVVAVLLVVGCIYVLSSLPPATRHVTATGQASPSQTPEQHNDGGTSSDGFVDVSALGSSPQKPAVPTSNPTQIPASGQYAEQIRATIKDTPGFSEQPVAPVDPPLMPGPNPTSGQSTGQMSSTAPDEGAVSGQSTLPAAASVMPAQSPTAGPTSGQAPTPMPSQQSPGAVQSSGGSVSASQPTQQPGIWQRPGR
jgi:hypothetical protein